LAIFEKKIKNCFIILPIRKINNLFYKLFQLIIYIMEHINKSNTKSNEWNPFQFGNEVTPPPLGYHQMPCSNTLNQGNNVANFTLNMNNSALLKKRQNNDNNQLSG